MYIRTKGRLIKTSRDSMKSQEFGQSMRNAEEKCKRKELFLSTPHPKMSPKKKRIVKNT